MQTLLHDLAQLEVHNADRDDQNTAQLIAQQITSTRLALLRVQAGGPPLADVLRATLASLQTMARYDSRATDTDQDVRLRVGGSIEQLRQRVELLLRGDAAAVSQPAPRPAPAPPVPPAPTPSLAVPSPPPPAPTPAPAVTPPPATSPPPSISAIPMGKAAFAELLLHLQRLSFSDEKIARAREAVNSGCFFTCEQAAQLMRTSAFADDQVKIGAILFRRLVDPQNFIHLTSALVSESDRDKLRHLVGR